jgi:hypothetical protein
MVFASDPKTLSYLGVLDFVNIYNNLINLYGSKVTADTKEHTRQLEVAKQIKCHHPKCVAEALEFIHLDHFKSHVNMVHGVRLRP